MEADPDVVKETLVVKGETVRLCAVFGGIERYTGQKVRMSAGIKRSREMRTSEELAVGKGSMKYFATPLREDGRDRRKRGPEICSKAAPLNEARDILVPPALRSSSAPPSSTRRPPRGWLLP